MIAILKWIGLVVLLAINLVLFPPILFLTYFILILGVIILSKKLTAGVLQGASYKETMQVEWQGDTFEIEIRALTNREATEIEALMQEGVTIKGKPGIKGRMERVMDFDTRKNTFGRNQADVKAVALGTVDESITEEVVENEFPHKLVKEIAQRIKEITGIGNQEDIEEFNEGEENPSHQDRE